MQTEGFNGSQFQNLTEFFFQLIFFLNNENFTDFFPFNFFFLRYLKKRKIKQHSYVNFKKKLCTNALRKLCKQTSININRQY